MIVDLNRYCGLDIKLDTDKLRLIFPDGLNFSQPKVRALLDMQEVLLDKDISTPVELYYMYRDVYKILDKPLLLKNKLRYDITIIKPDRLGRELMKTAGHYHPQDFGELYEVIYGHCFCLLQRPNPEDHKIIEEVILCEARMGEKIVIPPRFGHILINLGPNCLVTSNWVSSVFSSQYQLYKEAQGAAYFVLSPSVEQTKPMSNPYFKRLAEIKFVQPAAEIQKFGLLKNKPIYPLIYKEAEKLAFLNHPSDFTYEDVFI